MRQQSIIVAVSARSTVRSLALHVAARGLRPAAAPPSTSGIRCVSITASWHLKLWMLISVA